MLLFSDPNYDLLAFVKIDLLNAFQIVIHFTSISKNDNIELVKVQQLFFLLFLLQKTGLAELRSLILEC